MKAIMMKAYGGPEVLCIKEVKKPTIKDKEVLVAVCALTVSISDLQKRRGEWRKFTGKKEPKSVVLMGLEFSGVIAEKGRQVKNYHVGDEVVGMMSVWGGARTHAEFVAVPEAYIGLKPTNISHAEAATLPIGMMTSISALKELGRLTAGQEVLINGASGGVGVYAVQIAKHFNANVTAVCGGHNIPFVESLKADRCIDYATVDFSQEDRKYDIVFDVASTKKFTACKNILKRKGAYITTNPFQDIQGLIAAKFSNKKCPYLFVSHGNKARLDEVKKLVEKKKILPVMDRAFPMDQVVEAHRYSESKEKKGKAVLIVSMS